MRIAYTLHMSSLPHSLINAGNKNMVFLFEATFSDIFLFKMTFRSPVRGASSQK